MRSKNLKLHAETRKNILAVMDKGCRKDLVLPQPQTTTQPHRKEEKVVERILTATHYKNIHGDLGEEILDNNHWYLEKLN